MTSCDVVSTLKQHRVSRGKGFVWNELSGCVKNELGDKNFSIDSSKEIKHFLLIRGNSTIFCL